MNADRLCARPGCGRRFLVTVKHRTQQYCGAVCSGKAHQQRTRTYAKKTWPPKSDWRLPPVARGLPARSWWLGTDRDTFRAKLQVEAGRMQLSRFGRIEQLMLRDRD